MSRSRTENTVTLAELRAEPLAVVRQARQTQSPVLVTSKGKPDVVIMNAAAFKKRLKLANLAQLLAAGEADVAAGRIRPARDFFAELRRGKKASR